MGRTVRLAVLVVALGVGGGRLHGGGGDGGRRVGLGLCVGGDARGFSSAGGERGHLLLLLLLVRMMMAMWLVVCGRGWLEWLFDDLLASCPGSISS